MSNHAGHVVSTLEDRSIKVAGRVVSTLEGGVFQVMQTLFSINLLSSPPATEKSLSMMDHFAI